MNKEPSISPLLRRRSRSPLTINPNEVEEGHANGSLEHRRLLTPLTEESRRETASVSSSNGNPSAPRSAVPFLPENEQAAASLKDAPPKTEPVSWRELPRKAQLAILVWSRLAEPLAQTSLQSYMYYMLKSFHPEYSDATISSQAGILQASFTATQCLTALMWGRAADNHKMGRKRVLLIGLLGTSVSVLGFGFSRSFAATVFFRALGGALNGNVSVMRTMISEIVVEKKYQPKAFLVMPVTFNVGSLIGPVLGGWLQDPVNTFPSIFGPGSRLGGEHGVGWMIKYPYALPNIVNAVFLFLSALGVLLGLEETLIDRRFRPDRGLQIGRWLVRCIKYPFSHPQAYAYKEVVDDDHDDNDATTNGSILELDSRTSANSARPSKKTKHGGPKLPFRRIFTRNVIFTLCTHGLMAIHVATFQNLWFLFLSTPRYDPATDHQQLPFSFTGGLGLAPSTIGFAIGILGAIGLILQFGVYSRVTHNLGILASYRYSLCLFPAAYLLAPFLAVIPTSSSPPHQADGPWVWIAIVMLLGIQVLGRTFALPITQILVNNCTPHPSVLGAVHGTAQSVSSGMRTIGPVVWSMLYGVGLERGVVGLAWWCLSAEAVVGVLASLLVREGNVHEIVLDGDETAR